MAGSDTSPTTEQVYEALRVPCPTHHIPDCSPLLNGCSWTSMLREQAYRVMELLGGEGDEPDSH